MTTYNKLLKSAGFAGFGPKTKGGVPLFTGRYLDEISGRVKCIVKPPSIYNKTDYKQCLAHA